MRKQGILLPISSIPSKYGIGTFGQESYRFVDFLKRAGQSFWQILPLGPVGFGASPYQSFSTFAGNPYYIDPERLCEEGLLTKEECEAFDFGKTVDKIDYKKMDKNRLKLLKLAWERAVEKHVDETKEYRQFVEENADWLEDYALYMSLKNVFPDQDFLQWEDGIRLRKPKAMEQYKERYSKDMAFYTFVQYEFDKQWQALKKYANDGGIEIIGDIPIYVAFDSADTWANPKLFCLDKEGRPVGVAGCPPDAYAATGQLWGNPLYDWKYHKKTGFAWWVRRLAHCYKWYDVVRIDHFRGFDEYWFVPYGDETAQNGHWEKGPGFDFFAAVQKKLGDRQMIAEDLGFLTEDVKKLLEQTGFPGMKVLQFAFGSGEQNIYLPHNYTENCVVYTGTHDNDTTMGWLKTIPSYEKEYLKKYLNAKTDKDLLWGMIRLALSSVAKVAVIPMQDYLCLDGKARINTPSTVGNNWKWRMKQDMLTDELADQIRELTQIYGRL